MFRAKITRCIATVLSVFLIAGIVTPVSSSAQNVQDVPDDALSYAYGGQLDLRLFEGLLSGGLSVAALEGTDQSWVIGDDDPQADATQTLDVGLVNELISLDLGQIDLPLVGPGGLLEFVADDADLGVIHEFANAKTPNEAYGGVGLVSADGSTVDLTNNDSGKTHASVNLISLLGLNQLDVFTSTVIDTAALELGVTGSRAEHPDTPFADDAQCTDLSTVEYDNLDHPDLNSQYFLLSEDLKTSGEDNRKFCSGYMLADAKVVVDAPLIDSITDEVGTLVRGLDGTINGLLSEDGVLDGVLSLVTGLLSGLLGLLVSLDVTVGVTVPVAEILDSIINDPLSNDQETVVIDLKNGTILVDLQKLHGGDLSNLDPNTPLISSQQLNEVTGAVTSLLTDSKEDNPRGLMARVENALIGKEDGNGLKTDGLYGTSVVIDITASNTLGAVVGSFKIKSSLGALLNPNATRVSGTGGYDSNNPSYNEYYYDGSGLLGALGGLLVPLLTGVTGAVGELLETLLFDGPTSVVSRLIGTLGDSDLLGQVITGLSPVLNLVLQPLANAIVNRQFVESSPQGNMFTVSALELNVLTLANNPVTNQDESTLIRLPIATSAAMAQSWDLIDLDIDVAKIGDGRGLHTSGYTYNLVCEAPRWTGIEANGDNALNYSAGNVGTSFKFNSGGLVLNGATGGLAAKVEVLPGSTCTITTAPELESNSYLRPTGDTPARTPYTYFLDTNGTNALVSDESGTDGITETTTSGVTIDDTNNDVLVDASAVGDKWKNHSFTFVIPEDATEYTVNVVHAYEIDQRDVVVKKVVEAADPTAVGPFDFQYSVNGGAWVAPASPINEGEFFTIENVPLIDGTSLAETQIAVRETIAAPENDGPTVTWEFADPEEYLTATHDGTYSTTNQFSVARGITEASITTPVLELTAKNSYPVNVNFEAMLPKTGQTTLVWVIGLGLLTALGAVIMYVRSRKQ